jgi:hypothetical protein
MDKIGPAVDIPAGEDLGPYLRGWVDGGAGRPLVEDVEDSGSRFTPQDLVSAFELGREVARRVPGDAEVTAAAERISARLRGEDPPPRRRHLRLT